MDQQSCFSFIWMFLQENLYYLRKQKIYEISCKREDTWLLLWKYSGIRLEMFHCNCLLFSHNNIKIYVLSKVGYRLRYSSISVVLISGIFVLMLWFIIDSILFFSSLVLLINLDLRGVCLQRGFCFELK